MGIIYRYIIKELAHSSATISTGVFIAVRVSTASAGFHARVDTSVSVFDTDSAAFQQKK